MTAETHFSKHLDSLRNRLKGFEIADYKWLVKGDISGIQDFIFSVKSEKASKTLKGRSFFVQALSRLGIELLKKHLPPDSTDIFYDGGGNFFLLSKMPVTDAISKARTVIDQQCKGEEIYLALTEYEINGKKFPEVWKEINHQSGIDKLKKFQEDLLAFEPYGYKEWNGDEWKEINDYLFEELTNELKKKKYPLRVKFNLASGKTVDKSGVTFFGYQLALGGNIELKDYVTGLPKWNETLRKKHKDLIKKRREQAQPNEDIETNDDDIIEFSFLADFAKDRTGTDKLGILKLDVDNLGKTFETRADWGEAKNLSEGFSWFFGEFMNRLLDAPFDDGKFSDNLYVVFSGGDDTFIVGAWDAVFEFAHLLRQNFEAFATEMKPVVSTEFTFSAALLMVGPKFPVIRFAKAAEEALTEAKNWKDLNDRKPKNGISVFGQILRWGEFSRSEQDDSKPIGAKQLAKEIARMITKDGSSRSIIERIKRVAREYEQLSERAAKGSIPGPKVHRLFYTMRKWKTEKGQPEDDKSRRAKLFESEIEQFSKDLLESFQKEKKMRYPKYPVAARWAEFLTRK